MEPDNDIACLERAHVDLLDILQKQPFPILPEVSTLEDKRSIFLQNTPEYGLG